MQTSSKRSRLNEDNEEPARTAIEGRFKVYAIKPSYSSLDYHETIQVNIIYI